MATQQNILPMGRLQGITVDIDGTSTWMDFKVIEIVDEKSPYPALLGVDWATNMNGVIDLRQRNMIFEESLPVVILLDPTEGPCYIELVRNDGRDDAVDCIYKIVVHGQKEERILSRDYVSSCTSDSDEEDERW